MGTETKINCTSTDGVCIDKLTSLAVSSETSDIQNAHSNIIVHGKDSTLNGGSNKKSVKQIDIPTSTVPFVPIKINENDVINDEQLKELLKFIRPNWDLTNVELKKFTDGITNKLVGCFYTQTEASNGQNGKTSNTNGKNKANGHSSNNGTSKTKKTTASTNGYLCSYDDNDDSGNLSDSDNDSDTNTDRTENTSPESCSSNVVLVRVYGNKTDLLIDRKAEMRNILLLNSYGFAPPLYATFKNGLAYDYVPGVTLNANNVLQPEVWRLVACRMAEMHRLVNPISDDHGANTNNKIIIPMLWKKTQSFFDLVPEHFSDAVKHKRLEGTFLPIDRMRNEFAYLYKRLEALDSPLVFAHNDLLLGNVVYNESLQKVNFIDYEYADYNFQAFDIGNHFAEFAGVDEVDYSRYPTREFQYEWLRVYLQVYLERSHVSDAEVHRLYVQVNQFSLAAHFFWILWSLIQAEHSTIDFDYAEYAFIRYKEYLARKEEFLSLDLNGSS